MQVVNKDYQVVYSEGLDTIGKSQLSAEEFTAFLMESSDQPYHYYTVYQLPQGEYWPIVTFDFHSPEFFCGDNSAAVPDDMAMASKVIAAISLIYLDHLSLIIARVLTFHGSANHRTASSAQRRNPGFLRAGDYSARVDLKLKNEFANLQETLMTWPPGSSKK